MSGRVLLCCRHCLYWIYQCLYLMALPLLFFIAPWIRPLREQQLSKRLRFGEVPAEVNALFYCSSAGEYEQALPVLNALAQTRQYKWLVVFHSVSGLRYAEIKKIPYPFALAPFDLFFIWQRFFKQHPIHFILFNKYEVWFSPLVYGRCSKVLINEDQLSWWRSKVFDPYFHSIFSLHSSRPPRILSQDTKYDNILSRVKAVHQNPLPYFFPKKVLIAASVYQAELELIASLPQEEWDSWTVLLCPHKIDASSLEECFFYFPQAKRWSRLESPEIPPSFVVVDQLGLLFPLLEKASHALVGGSFKNAVHNILEPLGFGCRVAIGPSPYHGTQSEVQDALAQNILENIPDYRSFIRWLHTSPTVSGSNWVQQKSGATTKILEHLQKNL